MVTGIKAEAETQDDSDSQKRLLAAAKVLADATAKLVEAAKVGLWYHVVFISKLYKSKCGRKYLSGQATTINCTSLFDWSDTNIHVLTWNVVLHSTGCTTMISENYFCSVNIVGGSMAEG